MKIYEVINSFPPEYKSEFTQYLRSPVFNTNPTLPLLFEALIIYLVENERARKPTDRFYTKTAKRLKKSKAYLRKILPDLGSHFRQFLSFQGWRKEKSLQDHLLLRECRENMYPNTEKIYDQAMEAVEKERGVKENGLGEDSEYLYYKLENTVELNRYLIRESRGAGKDRVQLVLNTLDKYYNLKKLEFACAALNRSKIFGTEYEFGEIPDMSNQPVPSEETLATMYYCCFQLLSGNGEGGMFSTLHLYLKRHHTDFSPEEIRGIFDYAVSYALLQVRKGEGADWWRSVVREMYLEMEKEGLLQVKGKIKASDLRNLISLTLFTPEGKECKVEDFSRAEGFLQKYSGKVWGDPHNLYESYNLGYIQYKMGKYKISYKNFNQVTGKNKVEMYGIEARIFKVLCMFRMNKIEVALSDLVSFERFVQRKLTAGELSRTFSEQYLTFAKFMESYLKISILLGEERRQRLAGLLSEINMSESSSLLNRLKSWIQIDLEK